MFSDCQDCQVIKKNTHSDSDLMTAKISSAGFDVQSGIDYAAKWLIITAHETIVFSVFVCYLSSQVNYEIPPTCTIHTLHTKKVILGSYARYKLHVNQSGTFHLTVLH